eukprot:CAMPEP_0206222210 /NCGR_PEP_ID=MMETSP0047_2-20121206/5836_1 /ASSEMBLY_ACC=CAM_ASM_000192 /TAXON_ID=195065 /ORGANISM="Chroomonas mesostigmatica_cf, Strain CCMP1168" /LENGTH=67 /DNA_ID=CAMNT_0053645015 /DNA_START=35 /DNA_END=234 /DNA_ORIENTATION=-
MGPLVGGVERGGTGHTGHIPPTAGKAVPAKAPAVREEGKEQPAAVELEWLASPPHPTPLSRSQTDPA